MFELKRAKLTISGVLSSLIVCRNCFFVFDRNFLKNTGRGLLLIASINDKNIKRVRIKEVRFK